MPERRLIALVASLALLVVAFVMLGPGKARPVQAVRLYGGPLPEGAREASFRLVAIEEDCGFRAKVAGAKLRVVAEGEGTARWEGATGPDGTAEVRLGWEQAPTGPVRLRVTNEEGKFLAAGELPRQVEGWGEGEGRPAELSGNRTGEIALRVAVVRGLLAAPFLERVLIDASLRGAPAAQARLRVAATGARLGQAGEEASLVTDAMGRAVLEVAPLSHAPELFVEAKLGEAEGRFEAVLPVLPGAMWLEPAEAGVAKRKIVSPVERKVAYVAVATPRVRLFGAAVPLVPDGRGLAEGVLDLGPVLPLLREEPHAVLMLASSEDFEGAGTAAWPLWTEADPFALVVRPIGDVLLLDGLPEARAMEAKRRRRAALWAGAALGVATVLESLLLVRAARRGRLARANGIEADLVRGAGPTLALAIAATLLALAAVGFVVLLRAVGS